MNALSLFTDYAPNRTFIAIAFGALAGVFYALLIPIVMNALTVQQDGLVLTDNIVMWFGIEVVHSKFAFLFAGLLVLILLFNSLSEIMLTQVALKIRMSLRRQLYDKVLSASTASLENVSSARLIQSLVADVGAIVHGAQQMPNLLSNAVTLVGMLAYLAYLDVDVLIFVLKIIGLGVVSFQLIVIVGTKYYAKARDYQDVLQGSFHGLVGGAKELKLSQQKRRVFVEQMLFRQEMEAKNIEVKGGAIYSFANNYGALLCFIAVAGLTFVYVNYHNIANSQLIAMVMVLLYVTGPIASLLHLVPSLMRTRIALNKVNQLYRDLPAEQVALEIKPIEHWSSLYLRGVEYQHQTHADDQQPFAVGPVDIEIKRGEITVIAGGNGSGKSTLSKIISQHYRPTKGEVSVDECLIDSSNISSFREQVSCIYSDYHLFDHVLGMDSISDSTQLDAEQSDYLARVNHYLALFGLAQKVKIENGRFSTLKLSDGQRRRLALVVSIVEDKALYVFDEWAADQDPQFKDVFYRQILPYLKAKGKAIVVISHDDRFFDIADQLLVMEFGVLVPAPQILSSIGKNSAGPGLSDVELATSAAAN